MASSADQIIAEGNVEKVEAMQALIDRLTERCEAYKGQVETGASELNRLTAEVERLEAANLKLREAIKETLRVTGLNLLASKVVELYAVANEQ